MALVPFPEAHFLSIRRYNSFTNSYIILDNPQIRLMQYSAYQQFLKQREKKHLQLVLKNYHPHPSFQDQYNIPFVKIKQTIFQFVNSCWNCNYTFKHFIQNITNLIFKNNSYPDENLAPSTDANSSLSSNASIEDLEINFNKITRKLNNLKLNKLNNVILSQQVKIIKLNIFNEEFVESLRSLKKKHISELKVFDEICNEYFIPKESLEGNLIKLKSKQELEILKLFIPALTETEYEDLLPVNHKSMFILERLFNAVNHIQLNNIEIIQYLKIY